MPSGAVHPVPSAASGKQKSYASQAGPPVGSDQASTSCLEHHDGTCAPTGWPRRMPSRKSRHRAPVQGSAAVMAARAQYLGRIGWLRRQSPGLLASTGGQRSIRPACSALKAASLGNESSHIAARGLSELADWILSMTGIASAVAVAVEVPHGPVVDVLLDRGFIVHAINPKQLDRLRDRFSIAGAKDDRRDAYVSADGLRTDRHLFRRLQIADPRLIELRAWSRLAEELQEERVRLSNRLHQQLWRYYPQMLKLTDDLTATWLLELWLKA